VSTLAVNTITNAAGGNTAQINGMTPTADSLQGFRNRIINGGMVIDQRNAGASVVFPAGGAGYTVDRMQVGNFRSVAGNLTAQQSSVVPDGFRNSVFLTNGGAGASNANDAVFIQQHIEGFNFADIGWGTSAAQSVTISFWVRSSVTGTYGVSVRGTDRSYIASITINQANTYEFKTLTIPGVTSGTWNITNGVGVSFLVDLGIGSANSQTAGSWQNTGNYGLTGGTKWYLTSGATFYLTGVQLEAGSVATPFERRPYGTELALCQRYYWNPALTRNGNFMFLGSGATRTSTSTDIFFKTPVSMRAVPTTTQVGSLVLVYGGTSVVNVNSLATGTGGSSTELISVSVNHNSGPSLGAAIFVEASNSSTANIVFSAEL
jgi:hypothetical protein